MPGIGLSTEEELTTLKEMGPDRPVTVLERV